MKKDTVNKFLEFHDKSPIAITDSNGNLIWMNISFKTKFPAVVSSANSNIHSIFSIEYDNNTKVTDETITTTLFKCSSIFSGNTEIYCGVSITDGDETLHCFNYGTFEESDLANRIPVANMELEALSRELAKKTKEVEYANERVNKLLRTDFLTGCGNRRYFYERLDQFCSRYTRDNDKKFCLVFADLNKFKVINDTFGHDIGDLALTMFSQSMRRIIRKEDVFARIGGDEFALIIECRDERDCKHFIDKLRTATSTIKLPDIDHDISSSFGYVFSEGFIDAEKMMKDADEKLYSDKRRIVN